LGEIQFETRPVNGGAAVDVQGDIDIETAPQLKQHFTKLVDEGHTRVLINFSGVRYIDSSGLATLLAVFKLVTQKQGRIVFVNVNPVVRRLFDVSGVVRLFRVMDNETEGLHALTEAS
jgi:anti-sigma B factor antagonist